MDTWEIFILSELVAATALFVLLFAGLSLYGARIMTPVRAANRGLEAIGLLFLMLVATSLPLIPFQSLKLLGIEEMAVSLAILVAIVPLQMGYLIGLEDKVLRRTYIQVWINRGGVGAIVLAGFIMRWSEKPISAYMLALGILLTFVALTISAWIMLNEVRRPKRPRIKSFTEEGPTLSQ